MTIEQITLFGILFTVAVTVIGWWQTATMQREILNENRKSQNLDRELAIFRERLAIIRGITGTLLDLVAPYGQLYALVQTGQFTPEAGVRAFGSDTSSGELMKILADPGFRSIIKLLPNEDREAIQNRLDNMISLLAVFHANSLGLSPFAPDYAERLDKMSTDALAITNELKYVADLLAEKFAFLDRILATGE